MGYSNLSVWQNMIFIARIKVFNVNKGIIQKIPSDR
jgi:hypothetical protein